MEGTEYTFKIDAFTPDTIPMARLAEYMAALADLIGHKDSTHFVRLTEGSAKLVHRIEATDAPKVERRLREVIDGTPAKEACRAFSRLDELLADDNATGELQVTGGALVIEFPGRTRPKRLTFPPFRQDGSIEGQLVSVGGRDTSAHAILQDGAVTFTGCTLSRELARDLGKHLYGPKIRFTGNGRWERQVDGAWKLLDFRVDHFDVLDNSPLPEVLNDLRALPSKIANNPNAYYEMMNLGLDDGETH